MIYSEELKLVFLKGRKVAGTSVEILLSKLCGTKDIITPITFVDEVTRYKYGGRLPQNFGADLEELKAYHEAVRLWAEGGDGSQKPVFKKPIGQLKNHNSLRRLIQFRGRVPDDFRIFCVVRSPYSKIISQANMVATYSDYKRGKAELSATNEEISKVIDGWLDGPKGPASHDFNIYTLKGKLYDRLTIIRYENLAEDLRALLMERGVQNPPDLPNAKPGRKSDTLNLRSLLTPHQILRINEVYADEFEAFGFEKIDP